MLRAVTPDWLERERSIDVATAAEILGCDESTVRALVRNDSLDGHMIGKSEDSSTGVRINLQSVLDWKARHPAGKPDKRRKPPEHRRRQATASCREAMVLLKKLGSRI